MENAAILTSPKSRLRPKKKKKKKKSGRGGGES